MFQRSRCIRRSTALTLAAGLVLAAAPVLANGLQPKTYRGSKLVASPQAGWCSEARGAATGIGLAGQKLLLRSKGTRNGPKFEFQSEPNQQPLTGVDPTVGFTVLVTGAGGAGHRSAFAALDPAFWKPIGKASAPRGWRYKDNDGAHGGIRRARIVNGRLKISGKGEDFGFVPDGSDAEMWVHVGIGNTKYCAQFGDGTIQENSDGLFKARGAASPASCPESVCGNNFQEVGEACDDGDLVPDDGCANDCQVSVCQGEAFASTFEAIQKKVIDDYGCSTSICHGQSDHESGLYLKPSDDPVGLAQVLQDNYDALLTAVPQTDENFEHFVVEGDSKTSLFWAALYKDSFCVGNPSPPPECDAIPGTVSGMPEGGTLPREYVEAIDLWLRGGAPFDLVVANTADKLASCLPPADPLKIEPPPPPGEGNGVQLVSSAWSLPADPVNHVSENEVCFPIYYDFTATNLIPVDQQIDCPFDSGPLNMAAGNKCFRWHKQLLLQDPQSHHSIIHIYIGDDAPDPLDAIWGDWTYKLDEFNEDPSKVNGASCDPLALDAGKGQNVGCSAEPRRSAACISNFGPPDFNSGGFGGGGNNAPQFSGSQETHYEQELYDGVYSVLPMKGLVVFNSHAFNLTATDTTMNQYLNLHLAGPNDQVYRARQIFDADDIFFQFLSNNQEVPPFEAREYCATFEIPDGGNLFWLSSHTHRHGIRWRTWGPPNAPCDTGAACLRVCEPDDVDCVPGPCDPGTPDCTCEPGVCAPRVGDEGEDQLLYYSTVYNDPVQLAVDPPLVFDGNADDRRFLFCGLYDNGSTDQSPSVKRQSTSLPGPLPIGGPCSDDVKACINPNSPAKQGQLCGLEADPDRFCDSTPGAIDGLCDACPLSGGFTTEDEMFILLGNFYVTP
jgi:cysteine-rich repeat protein